MPIRIEHAVKEKVAGVKSLFIKSYGCQMNVYDGLRMSELMHPHGYQLVESADNADVIVLNTCHIREKADEKVFSDIGRMEIAAPNALIAVGGCTGQALGESIMQRAKSVRVVFGPQTLHRLPEFIAAADTQKRVVDIAFPELEKFDHLPKPGIYGPTAFLTIQEGCDKFCTYCVVPYTRGKELSRPVADIVAEAQHMADQGVKEITLLGQNVNAYHGEQNGSVVSFANLIRALAKVDGVERIRFTTSHPNNMQDDLIEAFATEPKLMPYLHLPVQAGSDKILAAMNRNHTAQSYADIIARVRKVRPDIAIAGDFIVGFPGETEADYQDTLALINRINYATAYGFAFSPRPGTPAAALPGQVDELVKKERLAGLLALLEHQQKAYNTSWVGHTLDVLLEEPGGKPGQLRGRSPQNVSVNVAAPENLLGTTVRVSISDAHGKSLVGKRAPLVPQITSQTTAHPAA